MNGLPIARLTYRQRPTKWAYLKLWEEELEPLWKELQARALKLVYLGRVSMLAYSYTYNLSITGEYRLVKMLEARAAKSKNPTRNFNQVDTQEFERCILTLREKISALDIFLTKQEGLSVAETEGAMYNARCGLTLEDVALWTPEGKILK